MDPSIEQIDPKRKADFLSNYKRIEDFFVLKSRHLEKYKNLSIEEILNDAPKHYSWIRVVEQVNCFIFNDKNWLITFVKKNNIQFDLDAYRLWKSGKNYYKETYDATKSPTKWIVSIQDTLFEIVKSLQILLMMELHINEEDYKQFLRRNPVIEYEVRANYKIKSPPSENINEFFKLLDKLLELSMKYDFNTSLLCDTFVCMQAYREIDNSKIFDLLVKKEFYIKYHAKYLKMTQDKRNLIPHENDLLLAADEFCVLYTDLQVAYTQYKSRLIEKYNKVKK